MVTTITAYEAAFTGGVDVAVGDVTGDGVADIVTGPGAGGGPRVRVFDGVTFAAVADYFAYDSGFQGGVSVASGPIGGGALGVVTGAGPGGGPRVRVFAAGGKAVADFMAGDPDGRGGVHVSLASRPGGAAVVTARGVGWSARFDAGTGTPTEASPFGTFAGTGLPQSQTGHFRYVVGDDYIDLGGNGSVDGVGIDTNGDGEFDGIDLNGDGMIDGVGIDVDGDGIFDGLDRNGDGVVDGRGPGGFYYDQSRDAYMDGIGYDMSGDGTIDSLGIDSDGDGDVDGIDIDGDQTVDGTGYDLGADGLPDYVLLDLNDDGVIDGVDVDADGTIDGVGIDVDQDGVIDGIGLDDDGDGYADEVDIDGDGEMDGIVVDLDGDGEQDAVGTDDNDDGEVDSFTIVGEDTNEEPPPPPVIAKVYASGDVYGVEGTSNNPADIPDPISLNLYRAGGNIANALTVTYKVIWSKATENDFAPEPVLIVSPGMSTATVTFNPGNNKVTLNTMRPVRDGVTEGLERFTVEVVSGDGYEAGSKTQLERVPNTTPALEAKGIIECFVYDSWTLFGEFNGDPTPPRSDMFKAANNDIVQRYINDCYMLSVAASMSESYAGRQRLSNMFRVAGNTVYTTFYYSPIGSSIFGEIQTIATPIYLGGDGLTNGLLTPPGMMSTGDTNFLGDIEIWYAVLEKAYDQFRIRNGLTPLNAGGWSGAATLHLTRNSAYSYTVASEPTIATLVIEGLTHSKVVVANSYGILGGNTTPIVLSDNTLIQRAHSYSMLGWASSAKTHYKLYNPAGFILNVPKSDLGVAFDTITVEG